MNDSPISAGDSRAEPKRQSRRQTILNEASRQLNSRGVSLATLKGIANALGVTRESLYYYIRGREELVFLCYLQSAQSLLRHFDEASLSASTETEKLFNFIDASLADDEPELCAPFELGMIEKEKRQTIVQAYEKLQGQITGLLKRGIGSGEFRSCDVEVATHMTLNIVFWLPFVNLLRDGLPVLSRKDFREFIKTFILEGTAADRGVMPTYEEMDFRVREEATLQAFDRIWITDVKREAILATASRLFNEKGVDTTTLEEIASQLGATTGALYHHLGDKETIVTECYLRAGQIAIHIIDRALELPALKPNAAAAFLHAWALAQMRQDLAPLRPFAGFDALTSEAKQRIEESSARFGERWHRLIAAGSANGEYRDMDLDAFKLILPGVSSWVVRMSTRDLEHQRAIARELAVLQTIGIGALPSG